MAEDKIYSGKFYNDIIRKCAPECYFICKKIMPDEDDAEKIFKEVFARAFKNPGIISGKPEVWFKNAVSAASALEMRKRDRDVFSRKNRFTIGKVEVKEDHTYSEEEAAALTEELLEKLPLSLRTTAVFKYCCDMTDEQISKLTDTPLSSVEKRLAIFAEAIEGMKKTASDCDSDFPDTDAEKMLKERMRATKIPLDIDMSVFIPDGVMPEDENTLTPIKSITLKKRTVIIASLTLLVAVGLFLALWGSCSERPEQASSSPAPVSVTSEVTAEEIQPEEKPEPVYLIKSREIFSQNGDKKRSEEFTYKNRKMTASLVTTPIFSEKLNYSYADGGRVCNVTDEIGKFVRKTTYDSNGNELKTEYPKKKSVSFKWTYKLNRDGVIVEAKCSGKLTSIYKYVYDDQKRIKTVTLSKDGRRYVTEYEYDDNNMVTEEHFTDWDGKITTKNYTYNYLMYSYECTSSDGSREKGTLVTAE